MELRENLRLLGLSRKEEKVLLGIQSGLTKPVSLSRVTKVSRPAVYDILKKLKERGLVVSRITNGKKRWQLADERAIEQSLYDTKKTLLQMAEGREEIHGLSDSMVIIHRGVEACRKLISDMFANHKNERFYGIQGGVSAISWHKVFKVEETNKFNRDIKKNGLITEGILPVGFFEEQTKELGIEWAIDFEGRSARLSVIDPEYFNHGGQMWVFKNSLYLFSLSEELIIEVSNSEIQKMILSIFEFIQDNSQTIDGNDLLRTLIKKYEEKEKK